LGFQPEYLTAGVEKRTGKWNREERIVGIRTGSRNTAGEEEKDRRKEREIKNRRIEGYFCTPALALF
jgi:hypothetical protein